VPFARIPAKLYMESPAKKALLCAQIHKRWAKFCIKAAEHPKGAE